MRGNAGEEAGATAIAVIGEIRQSECPPRCFLLFHFWARGKVTDVGSLRLFHPKRALFICAKRSLMSGGYQMNVGMKGLHPVSAFAFFAVVFCLTLFTWHPVFTLLSFFSAALIDVRNRKKRAVKTIFGFLLPLVMFVTVFNVLFAHYGVTVLFTLKSGNNITLESLVCGMVYGLRTACLLLWLFCFNETVDEDKFIYLFSRFTPRLALVVSMVLRFIPLFSSRAAEIEKARRAIGVDTKIGSLVNRLRAAVHNASILISWSLERALDTANSMTARGYGLKKRKSCVQYPFRTFDIALLLLSALSLVLTVVFRESVYAEYNPVIYIETMSARSIAVFAAFLILGVLPLVYDLTEEKRWSISN